MTKTSLIFKICGLFLAVVGSVAQSAIKHGGDIQIPITEPISILHGEYQIDTNTLTDYRPTWASVWKINKRTDLDNGMFYISTWPPKYCHAIYICPIKKQDYNDASNFKTAEENMCEKEYIKFYPHAKKLLLKKESGQEEIKFWMKNRLEFDIDPAYQTKIHVLDTEPDSHSAFINESQKAKTFDFDLNGKDLLILTNSRMCQVNKIGSEFYPFFRKAIQADPKFPKWLDDTSQMVSTDYIPSVKQGRGSGKEVDLLAYLKDKTWKDGKIGNLIKTCEPVVGWKAGGRKKASNALFKKVSVATYDVDGDPAKFVRPYFKRFTLNVEQCHWFRLWVSKDKTMDNYKDMKLSETIDFFLNEGFYISPESDEPHPLPGVNELTKFTFTMTVDTRKDKYVDMTYGEMQGSPIYHDQLKIEDIDEPFFRLHIIKAPGCEISVDSRTSVWQDYSTSRVSNYWNFGTCKFTHFE